MFSFQALNLLAYNQNDADFRLWGGGISAAIAAVGLVKTADTGQIDWATVVNPSTVNQKRGYEIWRFADALQATHPVFIRLDYGSGPTASANPQIWYTVGTATNGAGTITFDPAYPNSLLPQRQMLQTASADWHFTAKAPMYVSSDSAGSLVIGGWAGSQWSVNATYAGGFLLVERTRGWDGTPNGEGVITIASYGNNNAITHTLIIANAASYTQGAAWTGVPCAAGGTVAVLPRSGMTGGGIINVFPVFTGNTPQLHGPSKHVVAVWGVDMPTYARFPLTVYDELGTYLSLGPLFPGWETNALATCGAFRVA